MFVSRVIVECYDWVERWKKDGERSMREEKCESNMWWEIEEKSYSTVGLLNTSLVSHMS